MVAAHGLQAPQCSDYHGWTGLWMPMQLVTSAGYFLWIALVFNTGFSPLGKISFQPGTLYHVRQHDKAQENDQGNNLKKNVIHCIGPLLQVIYFMLVVTFFSIQCLVIRRVCCMTL
jgi:hypothetical protein